MMEPVWGLVWAGGLVYGYLLTRKRLANPVWGQVWPVQDAVGVTLILHVPAGESSCSLMLSPTTLDFLVISSGIFNES